ncbi:hypothetical protein FGO68_gene2931 [Halteria grandinella]|uniref:Uncharacterized protein n=1 Tax=Halteria grandinella TaxID=5974 RepID=A0A8J8SUD3_HALGN|nr:hypothetical protein FGO68_gene2931 [Halteria grandinella]
MGSCCTGTQSQEKNCQIILQTQIQNTIISEDLKFNKQVRFIQGYLSINYSLCKRLFSQEAVLESNLEIEEITKEGNISE